MKMNYKFIVATIDVDIFIIEVITITHVTLYVTYHNQNIEKFQRCYIAWIQKCELYYIDITYAVMVQNLKFNSFDKIDDCEQTLPVYLPASSIVILDGFSHHHGRNESSKV